MKTKRRYLQMGIVAAGMVIAFLAGMISADIHAKANVQALTNQQIAAIQGSYILFENLPVRVCLPLTKG